MKCGSTFRVGTSLAGQLLHSFRVEKFILSSPMGGHSEEKISAVEAELG